MDAIAAKAKPAPQPDSILRDALTALAAPASPVPDATLVAPSVLAASAAPSDGRSVALPAAAAAIATGGDTLLGRILTRATLADTGRTTAVAEPAAANDGARRSTAVPAAQAVTSPGDNALEAFLGAFASELARTDANGSIRHDGAPSAAEISARTAPLPPSAANPPAQTPVPFAIPIANEAASIVPAPPASAMPQPQHVDANAVVDQMLRGMSIRTTDGQSEVRLRLVPESLGDISVRLIVSGNSVDASITAHTADAQNALAGGQTQLAKTLADAGLKLQSFTVGLAGGGFADTRDQSRPNDAWTRSNARRISGADAIDADTSADGALDAVPSFGPPIYTARSLPGAYNYLV